MAAMDYPKNSLKDSLRWDETQCLNYYGMLSLHEVFEIVGSQLTESDTEVLSFLLDETFFAPHPLDPSGWTVEPCDGDPDDSGVSPCPALLKTWKRLKPQCSHALVPSCKPKRGPELLLELEKRGYISDGNLEPLLQLMRILTRHDLLPLVSHKRRRTGKEWLSDVCIRCLLNPNNTNLFLCFTVSPERFGQSCRIKKREFVCTSGIQPTCRQTEIPLPSFTQQLRTGEYLVILQCYWFYKPFNT